jgi:hypothetical protein
MIARLSPPRPTLPGRTPSAAVVLATAVAALGASTEARGLDDAALRKIADQCVVRFDVDRGLNVQGQSGSGVLIALDPEKEGQPRQATFVTAYHVLYLAQEFKLFDAQGNSLDYDRTPSRVSCFVDRSRELALVRVLLPGTGKTELQPIEPNPTFAPLEEKDRGDDPPGRVFGFADENLTRLHSRRVEIMNEATAPQLDLIRSDVKFEAEADEVDPTAMLFRMLAGQSTSRGMSGGLCVNTEGKFMGILYGRRRDRYNLAIPAFHVVAALDAAGAGWKPFDPKDFHKEVIYRGDADEPDKANDPGTAMDRMDLEAFAGLRTILGENPAGQLEKFEEVTITPRITGKDAPPLKIFVGTDTTPSKHHDLKLWHDGKEVRWDRQSRTASLRIDDKPGESLLTVFKTSGAVNDFELGGLLLPSTIDLTFTQGDSRTPVRHVVRSLPMIAQAYPLYITINSPPAVKQEEPPLPDSFVRIAVRVDYVEALLNQVPFEIQVKDGEFDGLFRLGAGERWRLERISPQRLQVDLSGDVQLNQAKYRDLTLSFIRGKNDPPEARGNFTVRGLVQFPRMMPQRAPGGAGAGLGFSARAIGTKGTGSWRVEVGKGHDLSFDVGGILRHLFTCYVNKRLIASDQPHPVNEAFVRPFLESLGLKGPPGARPRVLRVGLLRDDSRDSKDWLVAICDLGLGDKIAAETVGLGPAPESASGLVFEIVAKNVPGDILARFPNLKIDPSIPNLLVPKNVALLHAKFRLQGKPKDWFPDAPRGQDLPVLNENVGEKVARRFLDAFKASTKRGSVTLTGRL